MSLFYRESAKICFEISPGEVALDWSCEYGVVEVSVIEFLSSLGSEHVPELLHVLWLCPIYSPVYASVVIHQRPPSVRHEERSKTNAQQILTKEQRAKIVDIKNESRVSKRGGFVAQKRILYAEKLGGITE